MGILPELFSSPVYGADGRLMGDATVSAPAHVEKACDPSESGGRPEHTDDQREVLRALMEHFPNGIAHLLNEHGDIDKEHYEEAER